MTTQHEELVTIVSGELKFEIAPGLAARIVRMTYAGVELLVGEAENPDNWGATYWTSPQADWGWPPVVEVDSAPYQAQNNALVWAMTSPVATIGQRKFRVIKSFSAGPYQGSIDTRYSIVNVGSQEFKLANWEISRVFPNGVTFFPTGESEMTPIEPHHVLSTQKLCGCSFYDHGTFVLGKSLKLHADGKEGFLAHATERHLILKIFKDSLPPEQAPGEGECEIFANFDGKYVEIEVQGPYVAIAPGQSNDFTVRTVVLPLPSGLPKTDFEALADYARMQVQYHSSPDLLKKMTEGIILPGANREWKEP